MSKRIVFTGGGTAGHVTPNIALIHVLKDAGWRIDYIGSKGGIEQDMMQKIAIPFHSVSSGKLRRYFSVKSVIEPFKILWGIMQSAFLLRRLRPDIVFSKGGFVAFPVVVGAWLNRVPVIAHESDMSPGLANRLSFPFVRKICLTFEAGALHFKSQEKLRVTGTPIRKQLFQGNREKALALCGFNPNKPCLLVIGGSLGSGGINQCVREALPQLKEHFQVIHICGRGKIDPSLVGMDGYCQFEYVHEELADLLALSSLVISRAGANALYELLALGKPHILIPLSQRVSRGDQIQNARYFQRMGISTVIADEELTPKRLLDTVRTVQGRLEDIAQNIKALHIESATDKIVALIKEEAHDTSAGAV